MNLKTTSNNPANRWKASRGVTLIEFSIASGLASLILLVLGSMSFYSARTFASIANYTDLDNKSRTALDIMTKDIRQSERLTSASTTKLEFLYSPGVTLSYTYDPTEKTLTRTLGNASKVLLTECDFLKFSLFKRPGYSIDDSTPNR